MPSLYDVLRVCRHLFNCLPRACCPAQIYTKLHNPSIRFAHCLFIITGIKEVRQPDPLDAGRR